jgi:transcriptional regulator with XRE-family HTH domain
VEDLDFEAMASEWVRALRKKLSQSAFSRRLGYKSNVVHRWENGEAWPTASRFLRVCERQGHDVRAAYAEFFHRAPSWLEGQAPSSRAGVAALLRELRGEMQVGALADASGYSRYSVARWLNAKAEPKLPEFLRLVDAASRRALDLVATLQDPSELPSAEPRWTRLQSLRKAAYEEPWSHAVLRALELGDYPECREPVSWLSGVLGIPGPQVARALAVLESTGQVRHEGDRWVPLPATSVTTGGDPKLLGVLTRAWTEIALERLAKREPGRFGYSLFAVSRADLRRLRDLHGEYLREMQSIIAQSKANECVGLLCLQLLDLRRGDKNALAEER